MTVVHVTTTQVYIKSFIMILLTLCGIKMLSGIDIKKLARTLLIGTGITVALYVGLLRGCSSDVKEESELEKKAAAEFVMTNDKANYMAEVSLNFLAQNDGYSDSVRGHMAEFYLKKLEGNEELARYTLRHMPPEVIQEMKRDAIRGTASKAIGNLYDGVKEGVKIIQGE